MGRNDIFLGNNSACYIPALPSRHFLAASLACPLSFRIVGIFAFYYSLSRTDQINSARNCPGHIENCHVKNTGRCKELLVPVAKVYQTNPLDPKQPIPSLKRGFQMPVPITFPGGNIGFCRAIQHNKIFTAYPVRHPVPKHYRFHCVVMPVFF